MKRPERERARTSAPKVRRSITRSGSASRSVVARWGYVQPQVVVVTGVTPSDISALSQVLINPALAYERIQALAIQRVVSALKINGSQVVVSNEVTYERMEHESSKRVTSTRKNDMTQVVSSKGLSAERMEVVSRQRLTSIGNPPPLPSLSCPPDPLSSPIPSPPPVIRTTGPTPLPATLVANNEKSIHFQKGDRTTEEYVRRGTKSRGSQTHEPSNTVTSAPPDCAAPPPLRENRLGGGRRLDGVEYARAVDVAQKVGGLWNTICAPAGMSRVDVIRRKRRIAIYREHRSYEKNPVFGGDAWLAWRLVFEEAVKDEQFSGNGSSAFVGNLDSFLLARNCDRFLDAASVRCREMVARSNAIAAEKKVDLGDIPARRICDHIEREFHVAASSKIPGAVENTLEHVFGALSESSLNRVVVQYGHQSMFTKNLEVVVVGLREAWTRSHEGNKGGQMSCEEYATDRELPKNVRIRSAM